jgi:hypothetical protein
MSSKTFLLFIVLLVSSCAPSSPQLDSSGAPSTDVPELTDDVIRERINNAWIREVPAENSNAEPISWAFAPDEPKEIAVVDKKVDGNHATIVLDIKTGSSDRSRRKRYLAGQVRTEWELRTGWVMRRWEIVGTENISMKYKDLPKPANQNTNVPEAPRPPS